jgi:hypothetical protein
METEDETKLRQQAVARLKKRHDFKGHLLIYALVNAFLVLIWAITDAHGFFWPLFPMAGWGIGVVMNAWDVYGSSGFGEDDVRREMVRLRDR